MKTENISLEIFDSKIHKLWISSIIVIALMFMGCSQQVNFNKSTVVPAAELTVKLQRDTNNNYEIDIKVNNLAQPKDLTPSQNVYVVWVETKTGNYNIGQLQIDEKLKGKLNALTPYKPIRIKITAEENPQVVTPGSMIVLSSESITI